MIKALNKQLLITLFFGLIILGFLFIKIAKPQFEKCQKKYKALTEKQKTLTEFSQKRKSLEELSKNKKEIAINLKKVEEALPEKEEVPDFLVQLETLVAKSANSFQSINFQRTVEKIKEKTKETGAKTEKAPEKKVEKETPGPKPLSFTLNISGNFQSLLDFITLSESLSRPFIISKVEIKSQKETVQTTILGNIYYRTNE